MLYRPLGKSDLNVSAVAMGTWAIGGLWWGGTEEQDAIAAIQAGLDAGINLIDTAPMYGKGLSEEIIGRAIAGRDRAQIILATKCGLDWDTGQGEYFFTLPEGPVHKNLRPDNIRREVELSLKRLGTDYVDLYQTHWQDVTTPIADSMATLLDLQQQGKIRAIGVSNATPAQMDEYLALGRIDSTQPRYNMLDRAIEAEYLPYCLQQSIGVLSYSSLNLGLLTGKVSPDRVFPDDDQRSKNPLFKPEKIRQINVMLEQFAPLREKYGLNQTQLVIAWTISRPGMTSALVGVRNAAQAADIAPGGGVVLEADDLAAIDNIIEAGG